MALALSTQLLLRALPLSMDHGETVEILQELSGRADVYSLDPVLNVVIDTTKPGNVRRAAEVTASSLNPEVMVAWLTEKAQNTALKTQQRCFALSGLAACQQPSKTLRVLEQLAVRDGQVEVRIQAIQHAAWYKNLRTISVLMPLMLDNDDRLATAAQKAIDSLIDSRGGLDRVLEQMTELADRLLLEGKGSTAQAVLESAKALSPRDTKVLSRLRSLRAAA